MSDAATRCLGSLELSTAGLGCGNFGEFLGAAEAEAVVAAALEAGVTHFDTADVYGDGSSEEYLGRALGARRGEVAITTKFGALPPPDGSRPGSAAWVKRACEASLSRLGSEWIDLYLFHHPDPETPIAETLAAMAELRAAGKVREIGYSNVTPEQLEAACAAAEDLGIDGFCAIQNGYSLLDRMPELGLLPACARHGIAIVPYLPLAAGMLTGKYRRGERIGGSARMERELRGTKVREYFPALLSEECFAIVESLERYAAEHGHGLVELALGWLAAKPEVAGVIAGATTPEQVRANVAAVGAWELSAREQAEVERLTRVDVSFTWHPGVPGYSQPPGGAEGFQAPHLRDNVAAERDDGRD